MSKKQIINANNNNVVATEVAEREDIIMNNNQNVTNEQVIMEEKAQSFAESVQDKISAAAKYIMEYVPEARNTIKEIASMEPDKLEEAIKEQSFSIYNVIKTTLTQSIADMEPLREVLPGTDAIIEKKENVLQLLSDVMDDENKSGWGKFKAIVTAMVRWMVRVIVKAAQILLKIAVVLVVGTVKVGAVIVETGLSAIGVVHKEVVKPAYKTAKALYKANQERKVEKESVKEAESDWDDFFEECND